MDAAKLQEIRLQVASLEWYHTIDLGHGIVTPGFYDHRTYLEFYGLPQDLSGKTALDIGAASGFFAFEMEKRGAKVVATDLPEWAAHDFAPIYEPDKTPEEGRRYLREPFALAKEVLGSQVEKREISIYDLSPQTLGTFDLVFCGSLLLHLTDAVRALWRIRSVTGEVAIIATAIEPEVGAEPLARFIGHHKGDTWWLPNRACLEAMVQSAGFLGWEWVSTFRLDPREGRPGLYHGVIRAWNTPEGCTLGFSPPQTPEPEARSRQEVDERDAEIARLRQLVAGYEQGRFIRLMKWLSRWSRPSHTSPR